MPAPQDPDHTIPQSLSEALRRLDRARPAISPLDLSSLDDAVLAAARAHTTRRARRIRTLRIAVGMAASIALITAATWSLLPRRHASPAALAEISGPSQTITILDAFRLARLLEAPRTAQSPALPRAWDATGDGLIDQRDVEALAHRAVKLSAAPSAHGGGA